VVTDRKTVTRSTLIGEAGIALIGLRIAEMEHLWHPRRVDHGIDGHIDLVDPSTGAVLNTTVLVQSKASDLQFSGEDNLGFHYVCDRKDLDFWLAGNAPVIVVFSHPKEQAAWWVDIKAAFPDARTRAGRRVDVDKVKNRFDVGAASALLRLGVPRDRGLYLQAAPRDEKLITNLMPVTEMPSTMYVAPSAARSYPEAGRLLAAGPAARPMRAAFLLNGGNVLSFSDLTAPGLRSLCSGPVEKHDTDEWSISDDHDLMHQFQDLLLRTLQDHLPFLRWHKDRKHLHWRASQDLSPRKAGQRFGTSGRTVFGPHGAAEGGAIHFYRHAAVKLRARRIGGAWHVEIDPDYCFTTDGTIEHPRSDRLLKRIKQFDRHPAVRQWVIMWAHVLQGPDDLFAPEVPVRLGGLVTLEVPSGIEDSCWGPTPIVKDETAGSRTDEADDELRDEQLDGDDLLELLALHDHDDPPDAVNTSVEAKGSQQPSRRGSTRRAGSVR
jgi:hypothetical protein